MTAQFARGAYLGRPAGPHHEPHAALLIDFDNVTMGIRSDLTKELKSLLNSDIIKGKVAVQRAYADWRRYPQYIVPLAEASVDLIFAPAYGSSKKNATDIRLAIDALELVFTRPEIGTFILLSGDSDFSSLVLKLKEYGKYVIGVGIRESASDLLVQNCDEYYSYSALTGLTRASEEVAAAGHDPWELVDTAVRRMIAQGDVMRSDRLKQVILDIDSNFDEKTLGFSKFNRFVQEAATRGVLRLHKMENGQFEVALPDGDTAASAGVAVAVDEESGDGRRGRSRRGRGRRDVATTPSVNGAESVDARSASSRIDTQRRAEPPAASAAGAEPAASMEPAAFAEPAASAFALEPRVPSPPHGGEGQGEGVVDASPDLIHAYELLRRATQDVASAGGGLARDSDVKRRMLEVEKDWDESACGFSKFSRFLRQAHDARIIDLHRLGNGNYDVSLVGAAVVAREAASTDPVPADAGPAAVPARASGRRGRVGKATSTVVPSAEPAGRLPDTAEEVIAYLTGRYKGIGRRSGELLVDSFGAANVFAALDAQPERVREVLGARRGDTLMDAWRENHAARLGEDTPNGDGQPSASARPGELESGGAVAEAAASAESPAGVDGEDGLRARPRRSRGRRGGRRRTAPGKRTP